MTNTRRGAIAALALAAWAPGALRAQTYPVRPIRLVVPYPAGGGADLLARQIAQRLGEALKQTVNVDNKPGANGNLGARDAASAPPDGHTLVLVTDGLYSIAPFLLAPGTKDVMKDLAPVVHLVDTPFVLATRPGLGVDNLAQLIALAKQRPGELTYAANNTTSTHYLAMATLQKMAGIDMRHIPYAGAAAALPALVGGQIDLVLGQNAALDATVNSNRGVKYIAITSARRLPTLPNVPSVAETLPGYDEAGAIALMAPAGTPQPVIELLNRHVNTILQEPPVRKLLLEQSGATPTGGTPQQFREIIDRQLASRAVLIKQLGLQDKS